jgi:hypothetical protein
MAKRRRAAAAAAKQQRRPPTRQQQPPKRRKKRRIPTIIVHLRVALEDVVIRLSQADYQKLLLYWKLNAEDVILRGPYDNMETDIILRGSQGGMVSIRDSQPGVKIPAFKLVRASDAREEFVNRAGL